MQSNSKISVIISTYNQPQWLDLVLHSYSIQTFQNFEIIVADDGSDERTKDVIDAFSTKTDLNIIHVWQEDNGFQKTKILNKAITASNADYLIFTDGDCIARKDFVETHLNLSQPKCALSGGYFKLSQSVSNKINNKIIKEQKCFDKEWLVKQGQPKSFKFNKLTKSVFKSKLLNTITPTKATFDGMNVSCFRTDILAVNGFDERMQYGGQDRELGERLVNYGLKSKQIRYNAVVIHLDHPRGYKNQQSIDKNRAIRKETREKKLERTPFGIKKD